MHSYITVYNLLDDTKRYMDVSGTVGVAEIVNFLFPKQQTRLKKYLDTVIEASSERGLVFGQKTIC